VNTRPVEGVDGIPTLAISNPFDSRVEQGYDQYVYKLHRPEFKNNSMGVKNVLANSSSTVELPSIRNRNNIF